MTRHEERDALRKVFREVTLTLLGVVHLEDADPAIETAIGRGLGDVLRARLPEVTRPRAAKGRAALRALLNEIDRTNEITR
ncbi:MAG: hypothetical protein NVS3B10_25710 [Polyangiales bacterium]